MQPSRVSPTLPGLVHNREFYCLRMCSTQLEAEWRAEIRKSIPRLTKALKGSDVEPTLIQLSRLAKIRMFATNRTFFVFSNRSKAQLRGEVRAALPSLIALLKDPNRRVRGCALEALSSLAVIGMLSACFTRPISQFGLKRSGTTISVQLFRQ
jgi:hypothetical protein